MLNLPITQHQNGFLKIALPLGGRLHVWSPWNPSINGLIAEVHDHPFAFSSTVLAGEMQNVMLHATDDADGDHVEMSCACVSSFGPQPSPQSTQRRVCLIEEGIDIVRRGEHYRMQPWQLHRTDAVFALTLFTRGKQEEGHSHVYSRVGAATPDFRPANEDLLRLSLDRALTAAKLTLDDVVEIEKAQRSQPTRGETLLKSLPRLSNPGYHLRDIPRSPHGSVLKVVEEAMELAEAVEQGVSVMALCECADVVGALRGYLRRQHSDVSFDDLIKMADVTERAFTSGRRGEVLS